MSTSKKSTSMQFKFADHERVLLQLVVHAAYAIVLTQFDSVTPRRINSFHRSRLS